MAGVLVFVKQHHVVTGPLGRAHLRVRAGDARRQRDLIAVIEDLAGRLGRHVPLDQREQMLARPLGLHYLPNGPGYSPRQRLELRGEPAADSGDLAGLPQVLGQVAGQLEHGRGHRLRGPDDLVHGPVVGGHDLRRQLPGQRGRDQPHGRLEPLAQGVVADQPPGVGVIGPDHRVPAERVLGIGRACLRGVPGLWVPGLWVPGLWVREARAAQPLQAGAHPVGELGGRLPGEGEPEHPVRADHPVGDQPDQPGRHRLALARARAGHHRERPERRGDHRRLLCGRLGQPQQPGQLHRAVHDRAHSVIPAETTDIPHCNLADRWPLWRIWPEPAAGGGR